MSQVRPDSKEVALRRNGCLHPHPERVRDELFRSNPFFDPRDLTQVKYEMLRRARVDGVSVSACAARFGLSRVSFYRALRAWEEGGLPALLPHRPGPRGPHKLTGEVVAALRAALTANPALTTGELRALVFERFGLSVHRRSIERALARPEKNGADRRSAPDRGSGRGGARRRLRAPA